MASRGLAKIYIVLKMNGAMRAYDVDFPDWDNMFLLEAGSGT